MLTRLRTGTFLFTNNYVYSGKIGPEYMNKCMCCNLRFVENTEHLMLRCSAFAEEREKHLGIVRDPGMISERPNYIRGKLRETLGGVCPASGMKPAERLVKTIDYLSAISRKRNAVIGRILCATL